MGGGGGRGVDRVGLDQDRDRKSEGESRKTQGRIYDVPEIAKYGFAFATRNSHDSYASEGTKILVAGWACAADIFQIQEIAT